MITLKIYCKHFFKILPAGITFLCMLVVSLPSGADDLPKFRQGKWIFHRTVSGQSREIRRCIDPNEDILLRGGCTISSIKKTGDIYTFTAVCPDKSPSGAEDSITTTATLDVKSDSFYQATSERMVHGKMEKEYLDARRLGDCKK